MTATTHRSPASSVAQLHRQDAPAQPQRSTRQPRPGHAHTDPQWVDADEAAARTGLAEDGVTLLAALADYQPDALDGEWVDLSRLSGPLETPVMPVMVIVGRGVL